MRILLEIVAEIKRVVNDPTFLISVKINCEDSVLSGINADESIITAKTLEAAGVDLIEISGRTYEQEQQSAQQKVGLFLHAKKMSPSCVLVPDSFFYCTGSILY